VAGHGLRRTTINAFRDRRGLAKPRRRAVLRTGPRALGLGVDDGTWAGAMIVGHWTRCAVTKIQVAPLRRRHDVGRIDGALGGRESAEAFVLGLQLGDASVLRVCRQALGNALGLLVGLGSLVGGDPTIDDLLHHLVGVLLVDFRRHVALVGYSNRGEPRAFIR